MGPMRRWFVMLTGCLVLVLGLVLMPLQGLGQRAFRDGEVRELLEGGADLVEGQAVDVLQQERLGQDLRPQIAVGEFLRGVRGCDHLTTTRPGVAVAFETGHLGPGGDHVFLEVLRDGDGAAQPTLTLGTAP